MRSPILPGVNRTVPGRSAHRKRLLAAQVRKQPIPLIYFSTPTAGASNITDFVLREYHGATLIIRINRPERRNAFDLEVRHGLSVAIAEARDNDAVKSIIITGTGGAFCAGGDLKSISSEQRTGYQQRDRLRRMHLLFRALVNKIGRASCRER